MIKIPTIFKRNWKSSKREVIPEWDIDPEILRDAIATEKLDGTNVRITVRKSTAVRVEKRRNPTKDQKAQEIKDPWYIDAKSSDKADKWIFEAVANTDLTGIPDGEWSAEALGPKIQGNPLGLEKHQLFFFSVPTERQRLGINVLNVGFESLRELLPQLRSSLNPTKRVEGLVWWSRKGEPIAKVKLKDFQ